MPRTAEIAGAGLSGLVLASRLAQLGWKVRLHERNSELRMFGAGIWIWESGLRTLETLGAFDQATARARSIAEWRIAAPDGRVLMSRRTTPEDRLLLPPRADLYEALITQAQGFGVDIVTSSLAIGASPDGRLQMENGAEYRADLVVAADGAYSRLRESIFSTSWMDFGTEAGIRMMIEREDGDPDDTIIEYWHGRRRLLYNPCTDGQDYIFLSAPVSDERASRMPVDRDLWRTEFPKAAHLVDRFAEASRWDRLVNVRCRHWSQGHVAVIGDAAHAMPPNLGQAANTAFINAMALAMTLELEKDIPTALATWERENRALTDHVQWWSYIYGFVVWTGCAPACCVRCQAHGASRTD
jgi:2-polyprenyl-6-methoxyphenol hydroxylase-like FAD-dependent oxidoreductase